tara:strand:+ start:7377 stop:7775 length:399 start_codon:yes stop_codon:yes gene_type:complete
VPRTYAVATAPGEPTIHRSFTVAEEAEADAKEAATLANIKIRRQRQVRVETKHRIRQALPEQLENPGTWLELLDKGKDNWDDDDRSAAQALRADRQTERDIKNKAEALIASFASMTDEEVRELIVTADVHWS